MNKLQEFLDGKWTYRSFHNNPKIDEPIEDLLFGKGELKIKNTSLLDFTGEFDFGSNYILNVTGIVKFGYNINLKFRGIGIENSPTAGWIYDYEAIMAPTWLNGINQTKSVVGSVIRVTPHSNGNAKAGYVASFIMNKI